MFQHATRAKVGRGRRRPRSIQAHLLYNFGDGIVYLLFPAAWLAIKGFIKLAVKSIVSK
jgi:hypothetical protein